jgi:hypothetical protein
MAKQYKVLVHTGKADNNQTIDIQAGAAERGQPVRIKALAGAKYQLQEMQRNEQVAPDYIKVKRVGKHLHVLFEDQQQPSLIIEDYYDVMPQGYNGVIGQAENGSFYEYIPEDPKSAGLVPLLSDGAQAASVALGGAEVSGVGAALGVVGVAGFSPLLGLLGLGAVGAGAYAANRNNNNAPAPAEPNNDGRSLDTDTTRPTIAITSSSTELQTGQTATITFTLNEASADFGQDDVTVLGGSISNFQKSATNPLVYTATFTPLANATSAAVIVSSGRFSDAAGNTNDDGADANNGLSLKLNCGTDGRSIDADTSAPTIAITSNTTELQTGQTATITFTLSEASADFGQDDVTVIGGSISNLQKSSTNPLVYTATLTPTANATSALIRVNSDRFSDAAGNKNQDGADANNAVALRLACGCGTPTPPTPPACDTNTYVGITQPGAAGTNQTITGTGEPGSVVTVRDLNNNIIGSATVNASGAWSLTPTSPVPAGTITASARDAAGNMASANASNGSNPSTPAVIRSALDSSSDSGTTGDNKTNDATPTISGNAPVGSAVQVQIKNAAGVVVATLTPTVQPDGTYKITVPTNLADGTYTPVITVTPTGGSPSTVNGTPFTVDTQTQVNLTSPGSAGTAQVITGTGEPGAMVVAKDANGATIGSATVDANGQWRITPTANVPAGNVTVLATDPAGNTAGDSDPNNTGERNANAISGELDPTSDSGTPGDNKTNDATPTISGNAPVGSAVQVQIKNAAGVVVATLTPTVQPDGTYKITVPTNLADGTYTPVITVTPTGGSPSTVNGTPFTVDTQTRVNLTDPGTAGTRDPISGTGEPGAVVVAKDTNGATIGSATVDANGQWRITPTANVPAGNVSVLATDTAGNAAGDSDPNKTSSDGRNATLITAELDPTSDSGTPDDNKTNDATPTISGTAPAGATVQVQIKNAAGVVVATIPTTVQPDGTYKITVPTNLADGTYTPVITVTPTSGNPSTVDGTPFTIDTMPPTVAISGSTAALSAGQSTVLTFVDSSTKLSQVSRQILSHLVIDISLLVCG